MRELRFIQCQITNSRCTWTECLFFFRRKKFVCALFFSFAAFCWCCVFYCQNDSLEYFITLSLRAVPMKTDKLSCIQAEWNGMEWNDLFQSETFRMMMEFLQGAAPSIACFGDEVGSKYELCFAVMRKFGTDWIQFDSIRFDLQNFYLENFNFIPLHTRVRAWGRKLLWKSTLATIFLVFLLC